MTLRFSAPPEGAKLSARQRRDGVVEVCFDAPPPGWSFKAVLILLTLLIWWLLWLFALAIDITMIVTLLQGTHTDTAGQIIGILFVLIWLLGWGYAGMVALRALYRQLKGHHMLILYPQFAIYKSGRQEEEPPAWRFWTGGTRMERSAVGSLRFDNQGLVLTVGSQRLLVAQNLDSRSSQWLYDILRQWLSP